MANVAAISSHYWWRPRNHGSCKQRCINNKQSHGCNIVLPFEQQQNPYLSTAFETQFSLFESFYWAFIQSIGCFPWWLCTMDEYREPTLIRTNFSRIPTVLIGKAYWQGLIDYLRDVQLAHGTISERTHQLHITDDLEEALEFIKAHGMNSQYSPFLTS